MCIYHCINAWFIRWNCVICVTLRFSNFSVQLNPKWNKKHSHTHTNVRHTFSYFSMRFILAVLIKRTNSHPPYKYHLCTNICVCRNLSDIVSSVFLQFYTGGRWERAWVCVCVCTNASQTNFRVKQTNRTDIFMSRQGKSRFCLPYECSWQFSCVTWIALRRKWDILRHIAITYVNVNAFFLAVWLQQTQAKTLYS